MDTITLKMENLSGAEKKQLLSLVEKANKPKRFCLENMQGGENYFFIKSGGDIADKMFYCGSIFDEDRFALGNAFQTKEAAEFEVEHLKVIHEIKEFISENDDKGIDLTDRNKKKFTLFYRAKNNNVGIMATYEYPNTWKGFYSSSREVIEKMIETIGEERIKKYYFGITE